MTKFEIAGGHVYAGKVDGYDLGRTKYRIATRVLAVRGYDFKFLGAWAFPGEVEEISEEEARSNA